MKRETLTAGGWADLRDPGEIPERLRRPVRKLQMLMAGNPAFSTVVEHAADGAAPAVDEKQAAQMAAQMGEDGIDLVFQLQDRSILQRVMGWSYGPDVTLDALQNLPGAVYDELSELCKDSAAGSVDLRPTMDEASPIVPSTA
ncbi:hypothetical protein [Kitasatospora sp. GP82]|uniref:hypothetical protein n=1 Tax=Kitasatospora sp. GP82 TaxID=3035089 RepID=UPI0024736754|nr:hypothetical protein [Kitasatospora sp. GP82]MDH6123445.1 hypothetical protein [Kitasatospora sp. GP82]